MKDKKSKIIILRFALLFCIFVFAFSIFSKVNAAELFFKSAKEEIVVSDQFKIDFLLSSGNEEINAIGGKILFPADLLEIKEIRDGNSIINFWIEKPKTDGPGVIVFAGIIPGGYLGEGFVFSIIFKAKKEGRGIVKFQDAEILLNDGNGTAAGTKISNLPFNSPKRHEIILFSESL